MRECDCGCLGALFQCMTMLKARRLSRISTEPDIMMLIIDEHSTKCMMMRNGGKEGVRRDQDFESSPFAFEHVSASDVQ